MLWRMAWRNIWRNFRRTLLTLAAIGLGLALLIIMVSFMEGFMEMMVRQITHSGTGAIQIHHPDYRSKRRVHFVIPQASEVARRVAALPGVERVSERMLFSGAIRSSRASTVQIVEVWAVDPAAERRFSAVAEHVVAGGFVLPPPEARDPNAPERYRLRKGILIGSKLARLLKVRLGSKVRLDTAGFHYGTTSTAFYVTGIFEMGADLYDRNLVLVDIADMRKATGGGDVAHEIAVRVENPEETTAIVTRIRDLLDRHAEAWGRLEVLPWWELLPDIKQMIDISRSWTWLFYLMMLVVLSAGILTTMFMVIYERKREFGIQLAIGTSPGYLFASVVTEALFLALLSSGIGLIGGGIGVAALVLHGIDLTWLVGGYEIGGLFIENAYRGSAAPKVFLEPTIVVFLGTILFSLWPALKVGRMQPLDGIREGAALG